MIRQPPKSTLLPYTALFQSDAPLWKSIAAKYDNSVSQVILHWNLQQGVVVIPKSVHENRMIENRDVFDFELTDAEMEQIQSLDEGQPSMLDTTKPSEVKRVYDYLNNPVLTSL